MICNLMPNPTSLCMGLLLTAIVAGASTGASTARRANGLKVSFDVYRGNSIQMAQLGAVPGVEKRDDGEFAELELSNFQTFYIGNFSLGSNGQEVSLLVDTGSSDMWVMPQDVSCYSYSYKRSIDKLTPFHRQANDIDKFDHPNFRGSQNPVLQKRLNSTVSGTGLNTAKKTLSAYATALTSTSDYSDYYSYYDNSATTTSGYYGYYSYYDYYSETASAYDSSSTSDYYDEICLERGYFNNETSTSYKMNSTAPEFVISYVDGTSAYGFWGTDTIEFNGTKVEDCSFAVATYTTSELGVLGIGFASLEGTNSYSSTLNPYTYENFPLRLKNSGVIERNVYSLYLNSPNASTGSVLFGAVDHAKYSGQLQTVPMINIYPRNFEHPIRMDILLNSMKVSGSQSFTLYNETIIALLDSGTTLSYMPQSIVDRLVQELDAELSYSGYYEVDCKYQSDPNYIEFNFSGVTIKAPLGDFILESTRGYYCYLGILSYSSDPGFNNVAVLGDNFLRNAYVVHDLENYEISLAQVKYTADEDIDVVTGSVPSAVQAAQYSETALADSVVSGAGSGYKNNSSSGGDSGSSSGSGSESSGSRDSSDSSATNLVAAYYARSFLFTLVVGVCAIFVF